MDRKIKELIKTMERIIPEKGSVHVINEKKLLSAKRAILVEAHADDKALAEGLDIKLSREGVGIIIVTFTDGGARFGKTNDERLVSKRVEENIRSAKISEAAMVVQLGYPDGALSLVESQATDSFEKVLAGINPDFVIAPHEFDEHKDHASAFRIAKKALNGLLPLYEMDTITRKTSHGEAIIPTHYYSLSEADKQMRDNAYLAHESQVNNLPQDELQAVHTVLDLPRKRGEEIGVEYAGIAVKDISSNEKDPIEELLGKSVSPSLRI